jgi:DNA-binding CsgD family transcriptional regulator
MGVNTRTGETTPIVIGVVDAEWRVRRVSSEVEALLGYEPTECVGAGAFVAVHPEDLASTLISLGHAVETQASTRLTLRLWHKSDAWVPAMAIVAPFAPGEPFPFGFLVTSVRNATPPGDLQSRVSALEFRLQRIAAETRAAGLAAPHPWPAPSVDADRLRSLSHRQREITELLAAGLRVPTIAERLGVSQSTVRNHLSMIFRKFGVRSQAELVQAVTTDD